MEEKSNIFGMLCFITSRKVKMQLKCKNKKVCALCGECAVADWTCQKWFARFCARNVLLTDAPRLGRPVEGDRDQTETSIENNQHYILCEIADILKISKSSIENHFYQLGYVHLFEVWVSHKVSNKNHLDHISTCDSLLKYNENIPFLK